MPAKPYKERIEKEIRILLEDAEIRGPKPLFDRSSPAKEVGEFFQMVADVVADADDEDPVAKAFRKANLNPQEPFHWHDLLKAFVRVHYGSGKPGRPRSRDDAQLLRDISGLAREHNIYTKAELGKLLLEKYPERYERLKTQNGVRSRLRRLAIDPSAKAMKLRSKPKRRARERIARPIS